VGKGADVHSGFEITGMVEKPAKGTAPSNLYLNGRYILQPDIFAILENQERGAGNEIQLTDAMLKLERGQPFYGYHYTGRTFDCGSPEGFIEANIAFALWNPEMRDRIAAHIDELFAGMHPEERRTLVG
jgi:UTP--glucose-1-phosphate uridylyltransferase